MNQTSELANPANGAVPAHELFALTDEQILGIEPGALVEEALPNASDGAAASAQPRERAKADSSLALGLKATSIATAEPPAWLARQMKDPWVGEEARELWDGVLRAQAEAAEYRAASAGSAEVKAPKEIYPGGTEQSRSAAERARTLDEFDASYFGASGKSAEEIGTARAALAQRMLQEDPAAFEAMVQAGIKVLEEAKKQGSNDVTTPRDVVTSSPEPSGLKPDPAQTSHNQRAAHEVQVAAYSEFEKAANAELEKSVGGAIERALRQALPLAEQSTPNGRAQAGVPALQERLGGAIRQEIERALQGDRQLGEQVAQVLAARRFDEVPREQVVRLINERAQQLVPSATKRVLQDWTQTTLAAHRAKTEKQEAVGARADLAPAQQGREASPLRSGNTGRTSGPLDFAQGRRNDGTAPSTARIDYKKLSDEQILNL
jgi:hypothetical protein